MWELNHEAYDVDFEEFEKLIEELNEEEEG